MSLTSSSLLEEFAVLVVAGIPSGTEFGIDFNSSIIVGDIFRGVKMITQGPHYIYTTNGDSALRVGFFHFFNRSEILVCEWDVSKEELRIRRNINSPLEIQRIRESFDDMERYLAAYDFEFMDKWKHLTNFITENTIANTLPECGIVRTSAEFESCGDADRPRGSETTNVREKCIATKFSAEEILPNLKVVESSAIRFKKLPHRHPANATPSEISSSFLDSVKAVDELIQIHLSAIGIIEELQVSFVYFCSGYSLDALAHWKKMLDLLCNSETAVEKYKTLYIKLLTVLKYQLCELPEELAEATQYNRIYDDVKKLIVNCSNWGLIQYATDLKQHIHSNLNWDFENIFDEDPEDMPVIVEL